MGIFPEPSELPPGFGLRQPSGALRKPWAVAKAVEGHRTPRRYRAGASLIMVHACGIAISEVLLELLLRFQLLLKTLDIPEYVAGLRPHITRIICGT